MDDGGLYDCEYCKGKGVKPCTACQGQGWEILPFVNYRKFQPHPVHEEYHWARSRWHAKDRLFEKRLEKKEMNKTIEDMNEKKAQRETEEKRAKKAEKEAKRAAKQTAGGKKKKA